MRIPIIAALAMLAACGGTTPDGGKSSNAANDADGDGFESGDDCDDEARNVNPDAAELCNGIDDDCDGDIDEDAVGAPVWHADVDEDGYGDANDTKTACEAPKGYIADDSDCDDEDDSVNPLTRWYIDSDGDSFGAGSAVISCDHPNNGVRNADDCNDSNDAVFPDAPEICNGRDDDCDGLADDNDPDVIGSITFYADTDGDGYGDFDSTTVACQPPSGFVADSTDCDDTRDAVNPGATEICATGNRDDDCSGTNNDDNAIGCDPYYFDGDDDGYGTNLSRCLCEDDGLFSTTTSGDCNDAQSGVNPGADELCGPIDEDCNPLTGDGDAVDGVLYEDGDNDGFGDPNGTTTTGCESISGFSNDPTDCNDGDSLAYPGAPERCNGLDDDCDMELLDGVGVYNLTTKTEYVSVATAIGDGGPNETIMVCDGTWSSNLYIDYDLTLLSENGSGPTVLKGDGTDSVIIIDDATVVLQGFTIEDGLADPVAGGGGVLAVNNADVLAADLLVRNNAAEFGGGVGVQGSSFELSDSTITANTAQQRGGGFTVNGGGELTLIETVVEGNASVDEGGGGSVNGGSLVCQGNDTRIRNNDADKGGGVNVSGTGSTLRSCYIEQNLADRGGGIRIDTDLTLDNCIVDDNDARLGGGLFISANVFVDALNNPVVLDNSATEAGGGVRLNNNAVLAGDLLVSGNDAPEGGGIYARTNASFNGITLDGNMATTGAGAWIADGVAFDQNLFLGNQASGNGGGFFVDVSANVSANELTAQNNSATDGGGAMLAGSLVCSECIFESNSAGNDGGGLFLSISGQLDAFDLFADTPNDPDDIWAAGDSYNGPFGPIVSCDGFFGCP